MTNSPYPKDPIGLRWDDHYTMADQVYAAYRSCPSFHPAAHREEPPTPDAPKPRRVHRRKIDGKRVA